jgi:hypothetical protein
MDKVKGAVLSEIRTIVFLVDYLPQRCGIAMFTFDLLTALAAEFHDRQRFAAPVNDIEGGYDYLPTSEELCKSQQQLAPARG